MLKIDTEMEGKAVERKLGLGERDRENGEQDPEYNELENETENFHFYIYRTNILVFLLVYDLPDL